MFLLPVLLLHVLGKDYAVDDEVIFLVLFKIHVPSFLFSFFHPSNVGSSHSFHIARNIGPLFFHERPFLVFLFSKPHSFDSSSYIFFVNFINYINFFSRKQARHIGLLGQPHPDDAGKKCLVLDLDETLVHSSFTPVGGADYIIPVVIDKTVHSVYVIKRPGVDEFLIELAKHFEIILFTASLNKVRRMSQHLFVDSFVPYFFFLFIFVFPSLLFLILFTASLNKVSLISWFCFFVCIFRNDSPVVPSLRSYYVLLCVN